MEKPHGNPRYEVAKVARLYYLEHLGQREVSSRLGISLAKVSRLLREARETGVVEISVHDPQSDFRDDENAIERRFDIRECRITPTRDTPEATYRELSRSVGELLSRYARQSCILGVSWGETLRTVAEHLDPGVEFKDLQVVPILGGIGTIERGLYPNSIARMFADRAGGLSYLVNAPAICSNKQVRDSLFLDPRYRQVFDFWKKIDVAITGVSALDPRDSISLRDGLFSIKELKELRELGAVSSLNSCFFDEFGAEVHTPYSDRILNVDTRQLRTIANVVIVAAAPHKAAAIHAALLSAIPHVLVTDADTAERIIQIRGPESRPA